jgi:hypothetical protein
MSHDQFCKKKHFDLMINFAKNFDLLFRSHEIRSHDPNDNYLKIYLTVLS